MLHIFLKNYVKRQYNCNFVQLDLQNYESLFIHLNVLATQLQQTFIFMFKQNG